MIDILWDSSHIWGFLARNALLASGCPCRLLKAAKIAQAGLSGKVLLAPGGSARGKAAALGPAGQGAIRRFVARGGHYLGICGGAGLALAEGLALCPWSRASMPDRMQHLVSGHIVCSVNTDNALSPPGLDEALLPVWWPARFEEPAQSSPGVDVLARYVAPGPDLYVADLPYTALPAQVRAEWNAMYGVNIRPSLLDNQPCVIRGAYERGAWVLSYSHLESPTPPFARSADTPQGPPEKSPDSSDASRMFFHILGQWLGADLSGRSVPEWYPSFTPIRWEDKTLLAAREGMERLLTLAESLGLLFERRPWLRGWRSGVPGAQINSLYVALVTALSLEPCPKRLSLWQHSGAEFALRFRLFEQGARSWLLARRLSETLSESLPDMLPRALLVDQKNLLFGTPMSNNGLCGELQDALEALLFAE